MLADPNELWLGAEAVSNEAVIHLSDAELTPHDDTDSIDPSTFTDHWTWRADFSKGTFLLTDESTSTDLLEFGHDKPVRFYEDVAFSGTVSGMNISDDVIQFSALGGGSSDASTLQVRATSSDSDEIFEFDRNGSSDYNMFVHRNGARSEVMTDSHDILRESEDPYAAVADNGTEIHQGPATLDFGFDLDVVDNGDGSITVDYGGGDIPAPVDDDGTEVLANADGLDFQDYLDVADRGDNYAAIDVNTANLAELDVNETVSVAWTFGAGLTSEAATEIRASSGHLTLHDTDTADDDYYQLQITNTKYSVAFHDASAGTTTTALEIDGNQNLTVPNGSVTIGTETSATQPWVTSELGPYADTTATESIGAVWTHDAKLALSADNQLELGGNWQAWQSTSNADLYIDDISGSTPTTLARFRSDAVNFPQGAEVGGNAVATETWVGSNYAELAANETVSGSWTFSNGAAFGSSTITDITGADAPTDTDYTITLSGGGVNSKVAFYDADAAVNLFTVTQQGDANTPNGTLSEQGNRVATRTWTDSNFNNYSDSDARAAVTAATLSGSVTIDSGNTSTALDLSTADIIGVDDIGFTTGSTPQINVDGTATIDLSGGPDVDFPNGRVTEQGNRVSTRTWVRNSATAYDAGKWQNYDRYISSSVPSTSDPYLRFEPK